MIPVNWSTLLSAIKQFLLSDQARQLLFALAMIVIVCAPTFAQTGSDFGQTNTIEKTIQNIFDYFYKNVRLPLSVVGIFIAGIVFMTDEQNGKRRAVVVLSGVLFLALVPEFLRKLEFFSRGVNITIPNP